MSLNHVPDTNKKCWTLWSVFIYQVGPWLSNKIHILCHNIFCFWLADIENLREWNKSLTKTQNIIWCSLTVCSVFVPQVGPKYIYYVIFCFWLADSENLRKWNIWFTTQNIICWNLKQFLNWNLKGYIYWSITWQHFNLIKFVWCQKHNGWQFFIYIYKEDNP